jgi:large subunit ribosomal protein L25
MSEEFVLNAEKRDVTGKGSSRRLRRLNGIIPAIVYGGKKKKPLNISIAHKDIHRATQNESFFSHIITLKVGDASEQVILRDVQRHPAKPIILHADFLRISRDVAITVTVPIHFINEDICVGVKLQGGIIAHTETDVEVECLPADLPEYIEVDMAKMELDQTLHLSDLEVPKGVEIVALSYGEDHDLPVVTVNEPQIIIEDEETEAPETPDAPPTGDEDDEEKDDEEK